MKSILAALVWTGLMLAAAGLAASPVFVTAKSGLMLRAAPDRSAKAVTLMPFGSAAEMRGRSQKSDTIDGKTSPWFEIDFGRHHGWAFGGFFDQSPPEGTAFRWNADQTRFFILTNEKGPADACGSGYADRQCRITVYQDGKPIFNEQRNDDAHWVSAREIAFSSGLGECAGG